MRFFILFITYLFLVINRVTIKGDSGLSRINFEISAYIRTVSVYFYPSVPNTKHVSQDTDQNYSMFKPVFREYLEILSQEIFDKSETIQNTNLPLLVFVGIDTVPSVNV